MMQSEKLSCQSVDGICKMIGTMEGLSTANLLSYQETISRHNINGKVLLCCDLQELKAVLAMTFGDWEIFRLHIMQMRAAEINTLVESPMDDTAALLQQQQQQQQPQQSHDKTDRDERDSTLLRSNVITKNDDRQINEREPSTKSHRKPPTTSKNATSLEKQVTMEESMILGALETLNEEAPEDVNHLRELGSVAMSLSPILSDEESAPSPSESASSDPCATPICPQQIPGNTHLNVPTTSDEISNAEVDFVYIHKGGNSRYR